MSTWKLYARLEENKQRKCVHIFTNEGEACTALCMAVLRLPKGDWKLRKVGVKA